MWWEDRLIVDDLIANDEILEGEINVKIMNCLYVDDDHNYDPQRLDAFIGRKCSITFPDFQECEGYRLVISQPLPIFEKGEIESEESKLVKEVNMSIMNMSNLLGVHLEGPLFSDLEFLRKFKSSILVNNLSCVSNVRKKGRISED